MIKFSEVLRVYSGDPIEEIRLWITEELGLNLADVEWFEFDAFPQIAGSNAMRIRVEIITYTGAKHTYTTKIAGKLIYNDTPQQDT